MLRKASKCGCERPLSLPPEKIQELIRKRAYEIYRKRGNQPGDPMGDWVKAERMVRQELGLR